MHPPSLATVTCAATADRDRVRLLDLEVVVGLTGTGVRQVLETILPDDALRPAIRTAGLQEFERKMSAQLFLRSMVISASTGYGGRQADAMKIFFESGATKVVRGAFSSWLGGSLERVLDVVRERALAYTAAQPLDLLDLLQSCERHGVQCVIRLKENWKPKVDNVARGAVRGILLPGLDLDLLLDFEILALDGTVIDADVRNASAARASLY
jgi:hypothetical protein